MTGPGLFARWFAEERPAAHRATDTLVFLQERPAERDVVWAALLHTVRSHYLSDEKLAQYCDLLGYDNAARALRDYMPREKTSRSGELGEVLATEYVNEQLPTRVPIKRLRYKDERDTALRGDDLLGLSLENRGLHVLKGESKSRISLSSEALREAEEKLLENRGYPSHHSAAFIAARVISTDQQLAVAILQLNLRNIEPLTLQHLIFTLTQSKPIHLFPQFAKRRARRCGELS